MASTKWLHHRLWSGRLPLFHLLADEELRVELSVSTLYFGSNAFAELRTQVRLKLKETPPANQTRRSASTYAEVLELLTRYLPYLLALKQFSDADQHHPRQQDRQTQDEAVQEVAKRLAVFPPLFYGFGSMDLSSDRLIGREQRMPYTLAVDLMLTLFAMAQMHALYAEAQTEQAVRLQNDDLLQIAERSWQDAHTLFARASNLARDALSQFSHSSDVLLGTILKLFTEMMLKAQALGGMCAIHRIATRVYYLIIMDESSERLGRAVSTYARCAHTLARAAARQLEQVPESDCEQTVFQLDFSPDIALQFCDAVLRFRLEPIPSYSHRHDSFFTRIAQELQLVHQSHLNDAIDEKKVLLSACQQKFGKSWSTEEIRKADDDELLGIREITLDLGSGGDHGGDSGLIRDCEGEIDEENQSSIAQLLDTIDASVKHAIESAVNGGSVCATEASHFVSVDTASEDRKARKAMLGDLPAEVSAVVTAMAARDASLQSPRHRGSTPSKIGGHTGLRQIELAAESTEAVKSFASISSSAAALDAAAAMKKRPSSAQLPAKDNSSLLKAQHDAGWVKMTVGSKTLHFESASSLHQGGLVEHNQNHPHSPGKRRNAVPMAIADEDPDDNAACVRKMSAFDQHGRLKPRPSSSPSYLSTKKNTTAASSAEELTNGHKHQMWAPTRGQCALCERRYRRNHLAGVVVMKRIFDLRRKWGMVVQDSKKFCAASALYAKAQVCLLCQEILLHEDERSLQAYESEQKGTTGGGSDAAMRDQPQRPLDEIGTMIFNSIMHTWHQQPPQDEGHLEDVALNKRARQSSTVFDMDARNAVQPDAIRCAHTKEELQPWWEVDLANYHVIHSVKIWLREEISHLYNGNGAVGGGGTANALVERNGVQRKTLLRPMHLPLRHLGMFPLHLSISMKTGVGRDLDDILASCVSSHCVNEKAMPPIVWHAPPNSRGRFVRIQAESQAILHIEKVHVYIASTTHQQQKLHDSKVRKESLRQQLKRAAFRASIVVNPARKNSNDLTASAPALLQHGAAAIAQHGHGKSSGNQSSPLSRHGATTATTAPSAQVHPHLLVSAFFDPEQAEKKRISRLYSRFKSLLDARSKYMMDELDIDRQSDDE